MKKLAILVLLVGASLGAAPAGAEGPVVHTGAFAPGERLGAPVDAAPTRVSRASVRTVALVAGRASVDVPLGSGPAIVWTLPIADRLRPSAGAAVPVRVSTVVRGPGGARRSALDETAVELFVIAAGEIAELDEAGREAQEVLHLERAEAGFHRVDLEGAGAAAATLVVAEPESPLVLETWAAPLSRQPGEPVTIHARLAEGESPAAAVRVSARLAAPGRPAGDAIPLFDDGRHGDGLAGDGHWAARVEDLPAADAGLWDVRVDADGKRADGSAFERTGGTGFVAEAGHARLLPGTLAARFVWTPSGRVVRVAAKAFVRRPGAYRVDVTLGSPGAASDGSREGIAWVESTLRLEAGDADLVVDLPASLLAGRDAGRVSVTLLGMDVPGVAGRLETDLAPPGTD